jgi:hypothetical protein
MLYADLFESDAIAMFAYDLDAKRLVIHFKSGGVYEYREVPRALFDGFRAAASKGQYFQSAIRDRFTARRLSAGEGDDLARTPAGRRGACRSELVRVDIAALKRPGKTPVFF